MTNKAECKMLCKEIAQAEVMSMLGVNLDTKRIKDAVSKRTIQCAVFMAIKTIVLNV